jgi:Ni/Fe-hydrogenase 1 B-type cytochrome subunit
MRKIQESTMTELKAYFVWDANIRWFHWINVLCVLGLIVVGTAILNGKALGLSTEGKILLKTVHVLIGYAFAVNLLWRLIWTFIGGPHARWRSILPGGQGYLREVRSYISDVKAGRPRQYLGHNPLGRIAVTLLLFLLLAQAITGLALAGTDIFYPPLGSWIANWIAAPGVDPATLVPYAKETYDAVAYDAMRAFRKPFITIHYYGFYALLGVILIHILAVVVTELREGGNLISAMFTGKKILNQTPADL